MVNPSLEVLLSKVDNKYTLAVLAAKRAREILGGNEGVRDGETLTDKQQLKPVSTALYEIAQGKVTYKRTKAGIK